MWHALSVFIGASLWATDTLFRQPLTQELSAITIVLYEHAFAAVFALIWVLYSARKDFFPGWKALFGAILVGVFGSALATLLFTESFLFVNPSIAILLQKTQPIVVIVFSALFLGERVTLNFAVWAILALISAFYLSFPQGIILTSVLSQANYGALLALLAAILWAVSTVIGKAGLARTKESVFSFWRFLSGFITLILLSKYTPQAKIDIPFVYSDFTVLRSIAFMALIPGFLGVLLYYRGLKHVPASSATLLELAFPLTAIAINSFFLGLHLSTLQYWAAATLLVSMVGVSINRKRSI